MPIRLNKYLASLGIASRRQIDKYVTEGRIYINGNLAKLGDKVDPNTDLIKVDGKLVSTTAPKLVYIALNKPVGVISTAKDTHNRNTVIDLVKSPYRLFPVGRLDADSSGLILLTNDGALALKLTHPRYHLPKTYLVTLQGVVPKSSLFALASGVKLIDGLTAPADVSFFSRQKDITILKITLYQGKKRQIRRMCLELKLKLTGLQRIKIGPISLGNLSLGDYRFLTAAEISSIT